MPPRSLTVAIVVFWLAMTAWLVHRDVWPRLAPGEPPPFAVYYADDQQATHPPVRWSATQTPAGRPDQATHHVITTNVVYDLRARPRAYVLLATMLPRQLVDNPLQLYTFGNLKSSYRVSEEGSLLGFEVTADSAAGTLNPTGGLRCRYAGQVKGDVCELSWSRHGQAAASGQERFDVSRIGNVILPLHPVARMTGLSPGRNWGARVFDPLGSLTSEPQLTWVQVTVRRDVETLNWNGKEKRCRVVDYEGDGGSVKGSTWVEVTKDEVLKMEVRLGDRRWLIVRD